MYPRSVANCCDPVTLMWLIENKDSKYLDSVTKVNSITDIYIELLNIKIPEKNPFHSVHHSFQNTFNNTLSTSLQYFFSIEFHTFPKSHVLSEFHIFSFLQLYQESNSHSLYSQIPRSQMKKQSLTVPQSLTNVHQLEEWN